MVCPGTGINLQRAWEGIIRNSDQFLPIETDGHSELSLGERASPRQSLWPGQTWALGKHGTASVASRHLSQEGPCCILTDL